MSTKTLRKRIALVAVSAMGFGLLTSVSAHATFGATTGSVGLVGDFAGDAKSKTATVLSTGSIKLAKASGESLTVSAGAVISTSDAPASINGSQTCVDGSATSATIVPTGAVGTTFTIALRSSGNCATGAGTLTDAVTVTIASASNSGTASPSNSTVNWADKDGTLGSAGVDKANRGSVVRGKPLVALVHIKDVYNADVTTAGALTATVSSGALVAAVSLAGATTTDCNLGADADASTDLAAAKATYTVGVVSTAITAGVVCVAVYEKTTGAGWNGTLTVAYNGVTVGTKSGVITGDLTKLTATTVAVAKKGVTDNADTVEYQGYDSAGNLVATTSQPAIASTSNAAVIASTIGTTYSDNTAAGVPGQLSVNCGAAGKSDVVFSYVNAAGTIVKSNSVTVLCGAKAATYSASFDKASYKQGDIAKLTVKFLDADGNAANSTDQVSASTTGDQVISVPQMTRVTQAAALKAAATVDETGSITYTFTVGTDSGATTGSYNAVISFPYVASSTGLASATASNQYAPYTITSSGASISNAEVLAAIVKLIASINKQITALQKLLTKKK